MKKKLKGICHCWLIINKNSQPLYGELKIGGKVYKRLWIFLSEEDAEDYLKMIDSKKKRYIVKVKIVNNTIPVVSSIAEQAEAEFNRVYRDKLKPTKIEEIKLSITNWRLVDLLVEIGLSASKSKAKRLIEQNGVRVNDVVQKECDKDILIRNGMIIQVGKRKFKKLII